MGGKRGAGDLNVIAVMIIREGNKQVMFLPTRRLKFRDSADFSRKHIESNAYLGLFFHHFWRVIRFHRDPPTDGHHQMYHPTETGQCR